MLNRIHYISQGNTLEDQKKDVFEALEAGCRLIQVRFKQGTQSEITELALYAKEQCSKYDAMLIINDWVQIAKEVDADGVHLGLTDTSITEARTILGADKIIGGTANTLKDVMQRVAEKCDYIGLGPFRFTDTKEKLSPILGVEGYEQIYTELVNRNESIPIYAIGGITPSDIPDILKTGVYGIALSGVISKSSNKKEQVEEISKIITEHVENRR